MPIPPLTASLALQLACCKAADMRRADSCGGMSTVPERRDQDTDMVSKKRIKPKEFESPRSSQRSSQRDSGALSICVDCSKHESLKKFVRDHGAVGYRCGICHRADLITSRPDAFQSLSYLIRALIRFYYDEWSYNVIGAHLRGTQRPQRSYSTKLHLLLY